MLFSVSEYKTRFRITGTAKDEQIAVLAQVVTAAAERYTNRVLEYNGQETTEYHDGNCLEFFAVKRPPILSLTSLRVDGNRVFGADTELDASAYMVIDAGNRFHAGIIELLSFPWPWNDPGRFGEGKQSIKVVYRGGFDEIPEDLKEGAMLWAYHLESHKPGVTSETIGAYSTTYEQAASGAMPREVKALLGRFIRVTSGRRL